MGTGKFLVVNIVACRRLGYSREELLNMAPRDIVPCDQTSRIPKRVEEILKDGAAMFESVHIRRDGTTFPGQESIT